MALHDLKPVLARCKWAENGVNAPCCGSSPIAIVVWRYILDYDLGAITYPPTAYQFSAIGRRNGSGTAIVTFGNAKPIENGVKASCCG